MDIKAIILENSNLLSTDKLIEVLENNSFRIVENNTQIIIVDDKFDNQGHSINKLDIINQNKSFILSDIAVRDKAIRKCAAQLERLYYVLERLEIPY